MHTYIQIFNHARARTGIFVSWCVCLNVYLCLCVSLRVCLFTFTSLLALLVYFYWLFAFSKECSCVFGDYFYCFLICWYLKSVYLFFAFYNECICGDLYVVFLCVLYGCVILFVIIFWYCDYSILNGLCLGLLWIRC